MDARPPPSPAAAPVPRSLEHERMTAAWRQELTKLALLGLLGGLFGWMFRHPALGLSFALGCYLALHLKNLAALRAWLQYPKRFELPEPGGVWGEVYDRLLELQRKNRKKKKRLTAILAQFQASTAALPDGAVVLGAHGEIVWYNAAAQTLLGLRPQDSGLRVPNLVRHPDFTQFFAAGDYSREVEAPSPVNRNRTLSFRVIPYGNDQRLLIARDVSELRRLETARRDFVANASHELRTPLTVLRGYLDMMEPEAKTGAALAAWHAPLAEMRTQAARMESLVNDMLKLARLEAETQSRSEILRVPQLVQRVADEARSLSQGQHRFETQIQPGLGLQGVETELLSVFTNLVSNAVRYTPPGGVIRIRWMATGEGAAFSVADTGIGIAPEDIPRLTERFYRVDVGRSRASGGTGLGLSIVKHALERHDARLQVDSEPGVGSTFTCFFPAHRLAALGTTTEPAAAR